jgi:hypothetical protein
MALCLSGGGYSAMFFHLGTLWRLNELGLLKVLKRIHQRQTEHLVGRCGVSKPIRRLQDENLVSLVQWIGPHRTAKSPTGP